MEGIDYELLANKLLSGLSAATYKHTSPSGTPNGVMGHGAGGLFSHPALEKPVFSAMQLPISGLQAMLPVKPTNTQNPLYGIFTGVTATTGSEPTNVCDDPPYAGLSKLCMHSFVLGRLSRMTRQFELDAFGKLNDRADHLDLQLMNNALGGDGAFAPTIPGGNILQSDVAKALFEFGTAWARDFARLIWTGNPTNNTSGGYAEFWGLDALINTGYEDAITGTACPASDSYIKSFGNLNVATNGATLVNDVVAIVAHLRTIASETGLDPVKWVLAMRPALFNIITSVWPCAYLTTGCTTVAGNESAVYANEAIAMRDEMRQGSYLLIDGEKVAVVQDSTIAETNIGAGVYSSQIYFVPLTVLGATPVTYLEYFDYTTPNGFQAAAQAFAPGGFFDVSDNGRFAWHRKPPTNWCVQMLAKTEPRLLLLTPFIAARLTNIRYTPQIHSRDWSPSGTYFVNGGAYNGTPLIPSYYDPVASQR